MANNFLDQDTARRAIDSGILDESKVSVLAPLDPAAAAASEIMGNESKVPMDPAAQAAQEIVTSNQPVVEKVPAVSAEDFQSTIQTPQVQESEGALFDIENAHTAQQIAEQEIANAAKDKAQYDADLIREQNAQIQDIEDIRIATQEARQKHLDAEINKLKDLQVDLASQKIDPDRYWDNKSTASKIFASIGMILGGGAAAILGKDKSSAEEMIDRAIENDIEKQRQAIASKKKGVGAQQNILSLMKEKFKDEDQAAAAAKASMYETTQNKLKESAARFQAPQIQAKAQKLLAELEVKKQAALGQFQQAAAKQARSASTQQALRSGQDVDPGLLSEKERKRLVPGFGLAKDEKSAQQANAVLESKDQVLDAVNKIKELHSTFGTREVANRGAIAEEESTRRSIQLQLKELFNLGVLNGPDLELLNQFTGDDFFALTTSDAAKEAKLRGIETFVKNRTDAALRRANLQKNIRSFKPTK